MARRRALVGAGIAVLAGVLSGCTAGTTPVRVSGELCGMASDGTVVVTRLRSDPTQTVGWDAATGKERWRASGGCTSEAVDADHLLVVNAGSEVVRRSLRTGEVVSRWTMPDPQGRPVVTAAAAGSVLLTSSLPTDRPSVLSVVDGSTGTVRWTAEAPEDATDVGCSLDDAGGFTVCTAVTASRDLWIEVRDQQSGTRLSASTDPARASVAQLADGFAVSRADGETALFDADGGEIGHAEQPPVLALPSGVRVSTGDAKAWAGVLAVAREGSPVVLREGPAAPITTATGARIEDEPIGLSADGRVIAVGALPAAGSSDSTTLTLIGSDGDPLGEPTVLASASVTSMGVRGGLVVVGVRGDGDAETVVVPPER